MTQSNQTIRSALYTHSVIDLPVCFTARSFSLFCVLLLSACAEAPINLEARAEYDRINDPAEPTNRVIFSGNQFVDRNTLRPVARAYEDYVPDRARRSIHHFVENLEQPTVAMNDVLQGNLSRAWNTTQRFAINTTLGGAGLFDVATGWGRPEHRADFGQTFGVWGIGAGPAVQLPLFGPSNVRDTVGVIAGVLASPSNLITGGTSSAITAVETSGMVLGVVDGRAGMLKTTDALERNSLDYYSALRSVASQSRAAFIAEGKVGSVAKAMDEAPLQAVRSQKSESGEAK